MNACCISHNHSSRQSLAAHGLRTTALQCAAVCGVSILSCPVCCCRTHPHCGRVGDQLRDPQCHGRVVREGRNQRKRGKFGTERVAPLLRIRPGDRPSPGRYRDSALEIGHTHFHPNEYSLIILYQEPFWGPPSLLSNWYRGLFPRG
jgi:hypothetical protein